MKQHHFLDSSFITHAELEDNLTLVITFSTGSVWAYYFVPESVFDEFISSNSHGQYFNKNIRNKYSSEVLFKISKDSTIIYSKGIEIVKEEKAQEA